MCSQNRCVNTISNDTNMLTSTRSQNTNNATQPSISIWSVLPKFHQLKHSTSITSSLWLWRWSHVSDTCLIFTKKTVMFYTKGDWTKCNSHQTAFHRKTQVGSRWNTMQTNHHDSSGCIHMDCSCERISVWGNLLCLRSMLTESLGSTKHEEGPPELRGSGKSPPQLFILHASAVWSPWGQHHYQSQPVPPWWPDRSAHRRAHQSIT